MSKTLRIVVHVLLFGVAFVMFYIGLFAGLQVNTNLGNGLWLASAVIAILNIVWIVRSSVKTS